MAGAERLKGNPEERTEPQHRRSGQPTPPGVEERGKWRPVRA